MSKICTNTHFPFLFLHFCFFSSQTHHKHHEEEAMNKEEKRRKFGVLPFFSLLSRKTSLIDIFVFCTPLEGMNNNLNSFMTTILSLLWWWSLLSSTTDIVFGHVWIAKKSSDKQNNKDKWKREGKKKIEAKGSATQGKLSGSWKAQTTENYRFKTKEKP